VDLKRRLSRDLGKKLVWALISLLRIYSEVLKHHCPYNFPLGWGRRYLIVGWKQYLRNKSSFGSNSYLKYLWNRLKFTNCLLKCICLKQTIKKMLWKTWIIPQRFKYR
jgi:hypothetical protein